MLMKSFAIATIGCFCLATAQAQPLDLSGIVDHSNKVDARISALEARVSALEKPTGAVSTAPFVPAKIEEHYAQMESTYGVPKSNMSASWANYLFTQDKDSEKGQELKAVLGQLQGCLAAIKAKAEKDGTPAIKFVSIREAKSGAYGGHELYVKTGELYWQASMAPASNNWNTGLTAEACFSNYLSQLKQ